MDRLQSMRVFQQVVDEGGFAAAGRALDMSPAAVTRFISDLETHLGARLLQRTTRRLALTPAGEDYLARVRTILQEVEEAEAAATASTRELQGTLHMVCTAVLASYFLAPRVGAWRAAHPGVRLQVAVDPFPQGRVEEFDLSFLLADEGFDANIIARPLWTGDLIVCAAPTYLDSRGTPREPADLTRHDYLRHAVPQTGGARRMRLRPSDAASGEEPVEIDMPVVLQSESPDMLHRAAIGGAGVTVVSRLLAAPHLHSGALVHLLPDWIFGRVTLYAALPARQLVPARTQAFLQFLEQFDPTKTRLAAVQEF